MERFEPTLWAPQHDAGVSKGGQTVSSVWRVENPSRLPKRGQVSSALFGLTLYHVGSVPAPAPLSAPEYYAGVSNRENEVDTSLWRTQEVAWSVFCFHLKT